MRSIEMPEESGPPSGRYEPPRDRGRQPPRLCGRKTRWEPSCAPCGGAGCAIFSLRRPKRTTRARHRRLSPPLSDRFAISRDSLQIPGLPRQSLSRHGGRTGERRDSSWVRLIRTPSYLPGARIAGNALRAPQRPPRGHACMPSRYHNCPAGISSVFSRPFFNRRSTSGSPEHHLTWRFARGVRPCGGTRSGVMWIRIPPSDGGIRLGELSAFPTLPQLRHNGLANEWHLTADIPQW